MISDRNSVEGFITAIRESFDGSVGVYTKGSCVHFALILELTFPGGVVLWDENHAVYLLDGVEYDILGGSINESKGTPLKEYPIYRINKILESKAVVELL